jgi:hypothetical protein
MKVAWELSFKIEHLWNGQTVPWKNCTFGETGVYAKMHGLADCFDVLGKPSNLGCCPCSIRWRPRFGKGLAVQINGELQKCSSASLQDMFLNLVSNHLPRCGEKKLNLDQQHNFLKILKAGILWGEKSGISVLPNPSPPWKSPWSRTRTWSTKRHLCLRVIPAKGHQELAA